MNLWDENPAISFYAVRMHREQDQHFMRLALCLARRELGNTAENPAVGCVIVRDGHIVGTGWTAQGGRPHAEPQALDSAGSCAVDATVYVTLEPCSHYGSTPPCCDALIAAGVARVVVACEVSDSRVSGRGLQRLRDAGIEVTLGVEREAALALNTGFFSRIAVGLPEITVKIATSKDEKITTGDSAQPWITGAIAQQYGHMLRSQHQVIVTGIGTVLADDPKLTCRLPGLSRRSPIRVVLDRTGRLYDNAALFDDIEHIPLWVISDEAQQGSDWANHMHDCGAQMFYLPTMTDMSRHFTQVMRLLAGRGVNRVMIEGGQHITTAAIQSGIAQHLYWFQAPHDIGEVGMSALSGGESVGRGRAIQSSISLGNDILHYIDLAACVHPL